MGRSRGPLPRRRNVRLAGLPGQDRPAETWTSPGAPASAATLKSLTHSRFRGGISHGGDSLEVSGTKGRLDPPNPPHGSTSRERSGPDLARRGLRGGLRPRGRRRVGLPERPHPGHRPPRRNRHPGHRELAAVVARRVALRSGRRRVRRAVDQGQRRGDHARRGGQPHDQLQRHRHRDALRLGSHVQAHRRLARAQPLRGARGGPGLPERARLRPRQRACPPRPRPEG